VLNLYLTLSKVLDYRITQPGRRLMKKIIFTSMFFSLVISLPVLAVDTKEVQEDLARPINCATAEGDIRVLKSEKAHAGKQILAGVQAIAPPSLVFHLIKHTEDDQIKVATGEYDKMIDQRIAEIEADCK
jgi:hypothetical protein